MSSGSPSPFTVERTINAPIERVFAAFTNPELLKEWAAPGEHRNEAVEVDLRVGGRYRRQMRFPDGTLQVLGGEYREISAPNRLVYTFQWESMPMVGETLVTVELTAAGQRTAVRIRHDGFPTADDRDRHADGWGDCLRKLAALVARPVSGATS